MNLKQKVDKYLIINQLEIELSRAHKGFNWKTIADKIDNNIDPEYVRIRYRVLRKKEGDISPNKLDNFISLRGFENKEKGTKEFSFTADKIPTEEEIVKHFNIDLSKYKINQIWHKTTPSGKYSISVNLGALHGEFAVNYKEEFKNFLDSYNLKKLSPTNKPQKQSDTFQVKNSVLLNLSDLHVGKLAWDKEVGSDYNVDLAKQIFLEALKNLTYQSIRCFGVEEFVLNIGGDFLHTNGSSNTTANGTIMNDVDTRYQKIFTKGLEILTDAIDFLNSFEGVKIKLFVVQGNHDLATSYYLGEALKAFYRKDKNIEIINDPHIRKYYKYGVSSYMLTHGDCKDDGLPLTFATEKPDYFSSSTYRYIFLGHLHKASRKVYLTENEVNGVVLRRLNSLSSTDAWHNSNNYIGARRMANAIIFDKTNGLIAEFNHVVTK